MLSQAQRSEIENLIQEKLLVLNEKITEYRKLTKPIAPDCAIGRVSRMDAINNKSVNEAALRKALEQQKNLNLALENINKDHFGLCTKCGQEIPIGRIVLMPGKTRCVNCAN